METITRTLIDGGKVPVSARQVELREGAVCAHIRKLTSDEHIAFVLAQKVAPDKTENESLDMMAKLVIGICVEPDGTNVFKDGEEALVTSTFTLDDINEMIAAAVEVAIEKKSVLSSKATNSA